MNTHLKQLWAAMKLPKNFKKSYKFFCLGLDIRVPKLVEAENRALLVVAESRICYNADRLWFCRSLFCIRRRGLRMARKSRKRQTVTLPHLHAHNTDETLLNHSKAQ